MNHLDFLNTATKLLTGKPTEADIRSAISRSYYAVYHHALSWWRDCDPFPDYKDREHAKIQMALFNAGISAAKRFSIDLKNLNEDRRNADYELTRHFDLAKGQSVVARARRSIVAFDALDKHTLEAGVRNYLRQTNQI